MSRAVAIVFGGAGFIGRHLLRALAAARATVVCADIQPLDPPIDGVRAVHCDVRKAISAEILGDVSDSMITVFNLAAVHRTPGHPDRDYYDTNVSGALNVANFCSQVGARRLVFTSSISVYGPSEDAKYESSPLEPESAYGCSKMQAEEIHRAWQVGGHERQLVVVRPAVIFGVGENGNFTRLARALRRRVFVYPGRRDTIKACGYVDELVNSLQFASRRPEPVFLYNFCYPRPYTIEDICTAFEEVGGLPQPLGKFPYAAMRLAGELFGAMDWLGLASDINRARIDKLVRSTHIVPGALVASGYTFQTDLRSALARWRERSKGQFN